jgi:hypothetical protein
MYLKQLIFLKLLSINLCFGQAFKDYYKGGIDSFYKNIFDSKPNSNGIFYESSKRKTEFIEFAYVTVEWSKEFKTSYKIYSSGDSCIQHDIRTLITNVINDFTWPKKKSLKKLKILIQFIVANVSNDKSCEEVFYEYYRNKNKNINGSTYPEGNYLILSPLIFASHTNKYEEKD